MIFTWKLGYHGLDCEELVAVLGEHGDQGVQHDGGFGQVGGGHLKEDVLGVEGDLGVFSVDDGRQGEHHVLAIVDDGVHGAVPDDEVM